MIKRLFNIFNDTDKEVGRLRRVVAETNVEIERLLESQREWTDTLRADVLGEVSGTDWGAIHAEQMAVAASEARRLVGQADMLRTVIEKGEQTSRDLSVLLADAKQLATMNAEKTQRPPSERNQIEEDIDLLSAELNEQLAGLMEVKAGLREAILQAVPKAKFPPHKPSADELVKQVDAVAGFLGREVADYFSRTNETILTLRRTIGLSRLADLMETRTQHAASLHDMEAATQELVKALAERDLVKHLARQGLRLPAELRNRSNGGEIAQGAPQQKSGGRLFGRPQASGPAPQAQVDDL